MSAPPAGAVYLHGFASSPSSSKARLFGERLRAHGVPTACPDLNEPDFATLTVSRMIDRVAAEVAALPEGPVALLGSSLGGFVAWHAAARGVGGAAHPVTRLILLAPALDFARSPERRLGGADVEAWRASGFLSVRHHAYGEMRQVWYRLHEDALAYDSLSADCGVAALAFQGRHDTVVSPQMVESFAAARPTVSLRMLDDDHQLLGHLDAIWAESARFLGLAPR